MTPDRVQEIVDRYKAELTYDSWWPLDQRDVPISEILTDPERFQPRFSFLPDTAPEDFPTVQSVIDYLQANGVNPTNRAVSQFIRDITGGQ